MVREEDIKLMSRIAIYEKRDGKREIPINSFYKRDYVRLNVLKAIASATFVFVLIFAMVVFYNVDYVLANITKMDYKQMGFRVLGIYAVWILIYWVIARILYAKRYENVHPNIILYNHRLKKLQETKQKEVLKAKGGVVINEDPVDF